MLEQGSMMATTNDDWSEENLAEWRSLGERGTSVGIEQALREAGCSEQSIVAISGLNQIQEIESQMVTATIARGDRDSAVFFALVGRGISSVKSLDLEWFGLSGTEAAALFVNLSSNTNIKKLNLSGTYVLRTERGCTVLGHALRTNAALQDLHLKSLLLGSESVTCLMDGLKENRTLVSLDLSGNFLRDEGIRSLAQFLTTNATLKALAMTETYCGLEEANYLASALEQNISLEEFKVGGDDVQVLGSEIVRRLLRPLSRQVGDLVLGLNSPKNTTLRRLRFKCTEFYAEELAWLISTNKTLSTLELTEVGFPWKDWKDKIFPALKKNETLEELDLHACKGLSGIQDTLIDILRSSNSRLTTINLSQTEISSWQGRVDEELRINKDYRLKLRGQATVQTKSGRLVLCGYAFAGKTAISKTMQRIELGTPCFHPFTMGWKYLGQMFPSFRNCLFGRNAYRELATRTRGFDVVSLQNQPYLKSIWDFAGQREYYALHEYLFPDVRHSSGLYVCSCRLPPDAEHPRGAVKSQEIMRAECEFWMKFIASNSKPLQGGDRREQQLPHVRFVLTNRDTLNSIDLITSGQRANKVVRELKGVFKDVVELCETVEVVNAHCSEDVKRILTLENENLKKVLAHKTEYIVCEEVRNIFSKWSADSQFKPVVTMETFHTMREGRFNIAEVPVAVREALLPYLNDLGEVISLRGIDLIVVNPRWFGVHVLGSLIDAFKGEEDVGQHHDPACEFFGQWMPPFTLVHDKGYVDRKDLKELLKCSLETTHLQRTISSDKLIDLMIHLELCFEIQQPGNLDSSLFLPALFDDETEAAARGVRKLEWKLVESGKLHYLGRRLECENKAITFLTPGFFPRLQVHLRNYFHGKGWTANLGFGVDRNLICFADNGVEVLVEYSGDIDYFVDILVRSSKSQSKTVKFIDEHVITKIQQFCASQPGCQGVLLVEAVIRPECVKELSLCVDRKFQSVLVATLKSQIDVDEDYKHTWSHRIEYGSDTDLALDLLEGERPEMSEFPQEVSDQFPKLFYPSIEDVGLLRRLDIRFNLARKMPINLHLLCDHKGGSHKVEDQPGRAIQLNWKAGGYDLHITKLAVILLWAGVGIGVGIASTGAAIVNLPQVDSWIQSLFNVREMPDIDVETLVQMINPGKTRKPSEQEILKALQTYWKIDPYTQGLKEILNLQDGSQFWHDFRLRKVIYTETRDLNKIGWVCHRHYSQGLQQRILRSVPL